MIKPFNHVRLNVVGLWSARKVIFIDLVARNGLNNKIAYVSINHSVVQAKKFS